MTHWRAERQSGRSGVGGTTTESPAYDAGRVDPYPLPAHSLRSDPLTDADRSNIAGHFVIAFLSLWFLIPMLLAGIILHFR